MDASPFKETTTAIKRPAKLPPPTENNHEVEGGNRQDDYSDHEMDNLDWDVLEHPPDRDTKTKLDNTSQLPSEQRQAHGLLCQDKCGCKNSLLNLGKKTRIIKDYGLRNRNVDLRSNTYIAVGESLQSLERRQKYGIKTTLTSLTASQYNITSSFT